MNMPLVWDKPEAFALAKQEIADVLHTARDAVWGSGCVLAVAGGAARDIAHGEIPRDIDLVVLPNEVDDVYVILAALQLGFGYTIVRDYNHDSAGLSEDEYDFLVNAEGRWSRVVKMAAPGRLDLDVLVSNHTDKDLATVVRMNDFNINHYLIRRPNLPPLFVGENEHTLVQTRTTEVSAARAVHINHIATKLGWSLPA